MARSLLSFTVLHRGCLQKTIYIRNHRLKFDTNPCNCFHIGRGLRTFCSSTSRLCNPGTRRIVTKGFRYRLRVAYDGTEFSGWQFQEKRRSVQGVLEQVLSKRLNRPVRIVGAGRTDSGVHAKGQVAHFDTDPFSDCPYLEYTLNRMLSGDVRVYDLQQKEPVSSDPRNNWHAIFSARKKIYSYRFSIAKELDPLERRFRFHFYRRCNLERLYDATKIFIGTHDFTSFCSRNTEMKEMEKNMCRTIYRLDIVHESDDNYRLEYELNGALYRMIRNITSSLFFVASGELTLDSLEEILHARDRRRAPKAAPAHGLCLERVVYDDY
ncbi:hypothetical protein GpartN1_g5296.t1 [Galdieria partita]|uniref:tRNA pseudouridine synthase n=1 Tax=Galdieria partita TaxID=83374 RepID=A0A9C7PZX9_9RHOD|nr:hypothetical protein GpartN1_g5296.t1 [Galdieria partita]